MAFAPEVPLAAMVPGAWPPPTPRKPRRRDVDYAFAGGRLASLSVRMPDAARTARLAEAKDLADLGRLLAEAGYPAADDPEASIAEGMAAFDRELRSLCREGDGDFLDLLLTAHDAHNLKLFLKDLSVFWPEPSLTVSESGFSAAEPGQGPRTGTPLPAVAREASFARVADRVLRPSTVPPERLFEAVRDAAMGDVPLWLKLAASAAYDAYMRTGDAYRLDAAIDRAQAAEAVRRLDLLASPWVQALWRRRTDLVNLDVLLRVRAAGLGRDVLVRTLVPGGSLAEDAVARLLDASDDALAEVFGAAGCGAALAAFQAGDDEGTDAASRFGKAADDLVMEHVRTVKAISFSPEWLVAFRFAKEAEAKDFRIALLLLRNGLPAADALPLLREPFVR